MSCFASRPDRDKYIKIQLENLKNPRMSSQFRKVPEAGLNAGTFKIPYDITSIMHYGSTAFAKQGKFSIVRKADNQPFRANRGTFADSDIQSLNSLYKCSNAPKPSVKPPGPPPPPGPEELKQRCIGFAKLGLCDYHEICSMCNEV